MFSKKIILFTILISVAGFMACGDDNSSGSGDEDTLPEKVGSIEEVKSLKCDESVKCAKVFVEDGTVDDYFQCDGSQWLPITDTKFNELCPTQKKIENEINKPESSSSDDNKTESSSSETSKEEGNSSDGNSSSSDNGEGPKNNDEQAALAAELGACNENYNNVINTTESKEDYICEWNDDAGMWRKLTSAELDSIRNEAILAQNKAAGEAFLAQNKKAEGVITTESGLQYKILTEGAGATPTDDDIVMVHYNGTLIDGTKFDSSYESGDPVLVRTNSVIPGWTEMLKLMKVGEKVTAWIPSDLAYGRDGRGQLIQGYSVLVFELELIGIK